MRAMTTKEDREYDRKINSGKFMEILLSKKEVALIKEEILVTLNSVATDYKINVFDFSKGRFNKGDYYAHDIKVLEKLYAKLTAKEVRHD